LNFAPKNELKEVLKGAQKLVKRGANKELKNQ
jgi:hypothetical protein